MTAQEKQLPAWVQVGAKCRWHSESQKTVHPVVVTSIDKVKRRLVVHFEADHRVWKTVPFGYIGGTGPLQPSSGGETQAGKAAKADKETDGTATPPWYEQLNQAEDRIDKKNESRKKEDEVTQRQIDRKQRWQEAQQRKAEEDAKRREEERRRSEEVAEAERLRILEKLQRERELEQLRLWEVQLMQREDAISDKCLNAPLRILERKAREEQQQRLEAQRVHEEELRRTQEEHAQREAEKRLKEELANRPRVSFGVKHRTEPVQMMFTQQSDKDQRQAHTASIARTTASSATGPAESEQDRSGPPDTAQDIQQEPELDHEALAAAQRWADAYAATTGGGCRRDTDDLQETCELGQNGAWQHGADDSERRVPDACDTDGVAEDESMCGSSHWRRSPLPSASPETTPAEYYGARIYRIYEQHNPQKLVDVPSLMEKYAGSEPEMYTRICDKYGVKPDPPLPTRSSASRRPAKYARKAGAATPPPTLVHTDPKLEEPPAARSAPSASSLRARFASLLQPSESGGDASVSEVEGRDRRRASRDSRDSKDERVGRGRDQGVGHPHHNIYAGRSSFRGDDRPHHDAGIYGNPGHRGSGGDYVAEHRGSSSQPHWHNDFRDRGRAAARDRSRDRSPVHLRRRRAVGWRPP